MEVVVGRCPAGAPVPRLAQPAELLRGEPSERGPLPGEVRRSRLLEPVEQRDVTVAAERREHAARAVSARSASSRAKSRREPAARSARAGRPHPRGGDRSGRRDREPARARAPSQASSARSASAQPGSRSARAARRNAAHPPGGDANLVELLRIVAEPRAGIVAHDGCVLGLEHPAEVLQLGGAPWRGTARRRRRARGPGGASAACRPARPRPRAGRARRSECGAVAIDELDLELPERAR